MTAFYLSSHGDVMRYPKVAKSTLAFGMHDTLKNALAFNVLQFF